MVKSTAENLSPTRVKLTVEVPFEEVKPALDKAFKDIANQVQIPGFRKGKVPAAVVEQRFGRPAILQEAVNDSLPTFYQQAAAEAELRTMGGKQYVAVLSGVGGWAGIGLAAGLTDPTAGLGAVGGYAALSNYTALGGTLTVFSLPQQ